MESLFRQTDLESRIPLNMNVLDEGRSPEGDGPRECCRHGSTTARRAERRTKYRLEKIEHRLEVLEGYLIAYLNLDKVIKIIRTEDEPKPVLMKALHPDRVQAEAILNMRLRSLRKLEEMEIRAETRSCATNRRTSRNCSARRPSNGPRSASEVRKFATVRAEDAAGQAPHRDCRSARQILPRSRKRWSRGTGHDRLSEKGWLRALKGHVAESRS